MNCLILDNDIYYDLDGKTGIAPKDKIHEISAGPLKDVSVVVIDTLQKQVTAPEKSASKKDEAIASSFTGDYLVQSEQISRNLFQVVAVEKAKIAEVYKHLGFENINLVTAYGAALREFLKANNLLDEKRKVVFLDYLGNQVLLTIFNNKVFTTPRRLSVALRRVASELTRSRENYKALNKDEKDISFLTVTNSKEIEEELVSGGVELKENLVLVSEPYPALTGLKTGKIFMHYLLPEQFIRLRMLKVTKRRVLRLGVMLGILTVVLILFLGSFNANKTALTRLENLRLEAVSQDEALEHIYRMKYKDILKSKKNIDLPYLVNSFIEAFSDRCKVESIIIRNIPGGVCRFEAIVSLDLTNGPFVDTAMPGPFKKASVENIFVKGRPGLRVRMDIS